MIRLAFYIFATLISLSQGANAETTTLLCDFSSGAPLKTGKFQIAIEKNKFCFGETTKDKACVERTKLKASSPMVETKTCDLDCRILREAHDYFEFSNIFENITRLSGRLDRYNGNLSVVSKYRGNDYETFYACRASNAKRLF